MQMRNATLYGYSGVFLKLLNERTLYASPVWPEFNQTVQTVGIFFWDVFLLHPSIRDLKQIVIETMREKNLISAHQWEISVHGAEESLSVLLGCNNGGLSLASSTKEGRLLHPALKLLVPGVGANVV